MFKKLLKYDFKSLFSIWWIGAVSILALAIPTGLCTRTLTTANYTPSIEAFCTLWMFVYYMLIWAFNLLGMVLIFIRFYSNFFRDEGYLTFTLPVKRSTLYLSKVVSGTLINILSGLTMLASVCIVLFITPDSKSDPTPMLFIVVHDFFESIGQTIMNEGAWILLHLLFFLIFLVLSAVFSTVIIYMFITIGSTLVKKHKLLATIGIMYGSSFVSSMVLIPTAILTVLWFSSVEGISGVTSSTLFNPFITLVLLLVITVLATLISTVSLIIMGMLERKLNLQ